MWIKKISEILQTKTLSQSSLTLSATAINGILGLLFYLTVAKNLEPNQLGAFAFVIASLTLMADIGDLGTDTGLIRFVGKYINDRQTALKFLKLSLEVKLVVWAIVLIFGWVIAPSVVENIFNKPQLLPPLRMGLFGVGGALLFSFTSHAIQAFQRYKVWSYLLIGSNLLRILILLGVIYALGLNLTNSLTTYIIVPFLFFLVGLFVLPNFLIVKKEFSIAKEFFIYNSWIFLLSLVAALGSRLDIFLTTKLLPINEVGIYSVAQTLTSFIPQLFFAIATVAAPKLASFKSNSEVSTYLKKLQLFCIGLAVLGLSGIPIGFFIINNFYGIQYGMSFLPFVILYLAQLIFLISLPVHQVIFYFFARPKVMVPISASQFIIVLVLGWWLISMYGIMGAALAVLVGNIFLFIVPAVWVIFNLKSKVK